MAEINIFNAQMTSLGTAISVCNAYSAARSAVVATAGTGYKLGDVLTVTGGTNSARAAQFQVSKIGASGAILAVVPFLNRTGGYTTKPANDVEVTGGSGTGCQLTITWNDASRPENAAAVVLQPETQAVRYRRDGVAPTASVGILIPVNEKIVLSGDLENIVVIQAASSAVLNIAFYRG